MIKDNNYVTIQGWMSNKLGLKGNNLLIYAIIYGFSQDLDSYYSGSLQYLQDWTNSTRQGVTSSIKKLVNDQLIIKEESFPCNKYRINKDMLANVNDECKQSLHECKQSLQQCKQSLQNNNINNNINNIDNKYIKNLELQNKIEEIVNYLNTICKTHFKATTSNTKKLIKARINEGYTFEDFKDVIDSKWKEWGENPITFSNGQLSSIYIRPSTLFGNRFEEYLQAAWLSQYNENKKIKVKSEKRSDDRSNEEF